VGRGANLLLNIPPTPEGLIHLRDAAYLIEFNRLRRISFSKNLALSATSYLVNNNGSNAIKTINDNNKNTKQFVSNNANEQVGLEWAKEQTINCIVLKEDLINGQACNDFKITLIKNGNQEIANIIGKTIGNKRIYTFPAVQLSSIYFKNQSVNNEVFIKEIEAYHIDEKLIEK
jgi:alpha-L-fucosidase